MSFDPTKLGAFFRYNDGNPTIPINAVTQVVPVSAYRVWLMIEVLTGSGYTFRWNAAPSATAGFSLLSSAAPLVFSLHESGPLCQQQLNVFTTAGGIIYFQEVLWQPPSGE